MADIGPQLPPHPMKQSNSKYEELLVGPQLQPYLMKRSKQKKEEISVGPQLPPHFMKQNKKEEISNKSDKNDDGVYGPSLPPCHQNTTAQNVNDNDDSSSEGDSGDEVIGPMLPSRNDASSSTTIAEQFEARSKAMKNKLTGKPQEDEKLERESWMLELPPALSKNFGLGPRTFRANAVEMGDQSVWTDTPADRERKKQEAAEQKKKEKTKKAPVHTPKKEDIEVQNQVQEYNKRTRPQSLMEIHQEKRQKCSSDPATRRPFDRDRDLAMHRTDSKEKKNFIQNAKSFNSKFSSGNYEKKFL